MFSLIVRVLGPVFEMVGLLEAKGSGSFLKEKVYYAYQGKEYPHRKWFIVPVRNSRKGIL